MNFESFDNQEDARKYLHFLTNNYYSFAEGSERVWTDPEKVEQMKNEPFYQLMPDKSDNGFFSWYCNIRPNNQFFKTKEMCVLHFVKYWTEWTRKGQPNWKDETGYTGLY